MRAGVLANELFISSIRMLRTLCWRNVELSSWLHIQYFLWVTRIWLTLSMFLRWLRCCSGISRLWSLKHFQIHARNGECVSILDFMSMEFQAEFLKKWWGYHRLSPIDSQNTYFHKSSQQWRHSVMNYKKVIFSFYSFMQTLNMYSSIVRIIPFCSAVAIHTTQWIIINLFFLLIIISNNWPAFT